MFCVRNFEFNLLNSKLQTKPLSLLCARLFGFFLFLGDFLARIQYRLALVCSAIWANTVKHFRRAAFIAEREIRTFKPVVWPAICRMGAGMPHSYCHNALQYRTFLGKSKIFDFKENSGGGFRRVPVFLGRDNALWCHNLCGFQNRISEIFWPIASSAYRGALWQ